MMLKYNRSILKAAILAAGITYMMSQSTMAAELLPPDEKFIEQIGAMGIARADWDKGEHGAVTFPNAYRLTRSYRISNDGSVLNALQKNADKQIDLTKLSAYDSDGEFPLDIILRDRLKNHSLVILKSNEVLHEHYWNGLTDKSTHLDMSVTKSFTGILASIAADEGLLDMQAQVTDYLPEYKGTAFEGATVEHVADMRSGLDIKTPPHMSWDPRFTESQEWHGPNDSGLVGIQDYLKAIDTTKYPTGGVFQYQDPNTELLGVIVEKVTGKNLANYFEEKIWQKFGAEGDAYWMADPAKFVVAAGGLNMRTRDLARFGTVMLNGGKNHLGDQVVPKAFLDNLLAGNDEVRAAWARGKESALAADGWYKDQIRVLTTGGHTYMAFVGIHGQVLIMEPSSGVVIAFNGGYPQTETPRMAMLIFHQIVPVLLDAATKL